MPSKSKVKGSSAERELAKYLTELFNGNFQRVPTSGAFVGGVNFHRKQHMSENQIRSMKADITPPDFMPKLVIETKFYKELPFHLFFSEKGVLIVDSWIEDLEHDCDHNDIGILCIKINRKGWFICLKQEIIEKYNIILNNHARYKNYIVTELKPFLESNKQIFLDISK